ncbi:MAG: amidohydrolase [Sphingopyxis sp.]
MRRIITKLATGVAGVAAMALATSAGAQTPDAVTLNAQIAQHMPSLMDIYRDMHAHPELSGMEVQSAARLAGEARRLGFDVTENIGGHGVVAVMRNGPGPVLLIRADMDGLPVTENTGLPYASRVRVTTAQGVETGVMHACGHDTHMTAWIGTARTMAANRAHWSGTLVMIGQPAEETVTGARAMLADGLFTRFPRPTHALAFHDAAGFPAGAIGYTPGFALANVDSVDIVVRGVGGHGSMPQTTRDPIVLASRIVTTLQTLVSREVDPQDAAVVTVGSFHAGTKHNIISDEARLQLTVRSYSDATRRLLLDGIARIARGEAMAAGMADDHMPSVTVDSAQSANATYNVPEFTDQMAAFLRGHFGEQRIIRVPPSMGAEDFSEIYRADNSIKTMIFWVGGVPRAQFDAAQANHTPMASLHSATWAPDAPAVIATATQAMSAMAMEVLKKN